MPCITCPSTEAIKFYLCIYYIILICAHSVIDCGDLTDPLNGVVNLTNTTFGSQASYTCDTGFMLSSSQTRICQDDGNWSNSEPECTSKHMHMIDND